MTNNGEINTYAPCGLHKNGHSPDCKDCEVDALRNLLREVANCDAAMLAMPKELFNKIARLRSGGRKWLNRPTV